MLIHRVTCYYIEGFLEIPPRGIDKNASYAGLYASSTVPAGWDRRDLLSMIIDHIPHA